MVCWWSWLSCQNLKCNLFTGLNQNPTFSPPLYRQHPSRLKGSFLHRPVWAGAPEASCCQPPPVCRPLLQGRQPHPEERCCQAPAGSWCCHSSAGSAWTLHYRPGETGHWEGPSKEAAANGKRYFGISEVVRRLRSGYTIIIIHINSQLPSSLVSSHYYYVIVVITARNSSSSQFEFPSSRIWYQAVTSEGCWTSLKHISCT